MISRWLHASILSLLIAACGGGSGGSDLQADSAAGARPPGSGSPSDGAPTPSPSPDPESPQLPPSGNDNGGNEVPAPGPLADLRFENPYEIATDANGNLYVVDGENNRARMRRIAPNGSVTTLLPESDQTITALAVTPSGEIFYSAAADPYSGEGYIWRIENGVPVQLTSEEMAIAEFVIDPSNGNFYVGIWTPDGPEVKEVQQDGGITTLFSIDEAHGAPEVMTLRDDVLWLVWRDGPYRTREFRWSRANGLEEILIDLDYVTGMEASDAGIYVVGYRGSSANLSIASSCTVKLLDPDTLELTHLAGVEGEPCHYQEDTPPPGRIDLRHTSLTQAADGNLYLTENFRDVLRRITPAGEVTTYAGVHNQPGF